MRVFAVLITVLFCFTGSAFAQSNCIGVTCSVREDLDCDDEEDTNCENWVRCFVAGESNSFCTSFGGYSVEHDDPFYSGYRSAFENEAGFSRVCFLPEEELICSRRAFCTNCRLGQNAGGFIDLFCGYPGGGPTWLKYKWSIDFTMSLSCVGDGA